MGGLNDLNDRLFRELDRLEECNPEDLQSEIDRAKVIAEIAQQAIGNANTMLKAVELQNRAMDGTAAAVQVPKGLLGQ